jgi:PPOX class probable F420-dependent enzyme
MPRSIATADHVDRQALLDFVRTRHHAVLITTRRDGRPQSSPVTCGLTSTDQLVVSTYPDRAKAVNARRDPRVSLCVLSDDFGGPYVHVDGQAQVTDMPEAEDGLVEYFRCISGEHPDWGEYRRAMREQDKSLITVDISAWGPIATGGFPARLAD